MPDQLAGLLQTILPEDTKVDHAGGLFSKKSVKRVAVTLGDTRYTLEAEGHRPLAASRTRIVRGIALKTEPVTVDEWLAELGAALDERAKTSAATRAALSRIVGELPPPV